MAKNEKKEADTVEQDQSSLIRELEEKLVKAQAELEEAREKDDNSDLIARLSDQNERLMALVHAKELAGKDTGEDDLVDVVCNVNQYINVQVLDPNGTVPQLFRFQTKGDTHRMTRKQVREIQDKYSNLIDDGLLVVSGDTADNPNVILDIGKFIDDLDEGEVKEAINAITSATTLSHIFNYVEDLRFGGMVQGRDGVTLEELDLPIKYMAVEKAVKDRLFELKGIQLGLE